MGHHGAQNSIARIVNARLKEIWKKRNITKANKIRLAQTYVFDVKRL